ncbi:MAG: DMT family transporter [Planctomycetaceae bacterium]|jgi:drug/metabolite transporter (DMT)-like permease|nr:DMT family transporter [Planctomycetaceae bacterium]
MTNFYDFWQQKTKKMFLSDKFLGTIFCILADSLFCLSYFFVRVLTTYGDQIHGDWTMCFKEVITISFSIPIFLFLWMRGQCSLPSWKIIVLLLCAAFFCEFIGVRSHITAFGLIGIVLGNPVIRTFTILGTAIISMVFIRERLTLLKTITMFILISSIFVLAFSQLTVSENKVHVHFDSTFLMGFIFALITGIGYAIYSVLLRFILRKATTEQKNVTTSEPVSIFFVVSIVCGFGAICGAIFLLKDRGFYGFINVPASAWLFVGLAGILNVVCFYLKNLSFRYATATKVATFSILQIILGTILGIIFLGEMTNVFIWIGLSLSILGIALASQTS